MDRVVKEYQAIVWVLGTGEFQPPLRVTVAARDQAEAKRLIVERFGGDITCSIWNNEEARDRWPSPSELEEEREYKAVVWTKDPDRPGQRLTVRAKSLNEAKRLVEELFDEEITSSVWNEEDAKRTR